VISSVMLSVIDISIARHTITHLLLLQDDHGVL
jgi:hypothetical protein